MQGDSPQIKGLQLTGSQTFLVGGDSTNRSHTMSATYYSAWFVDVLQKS